MRFFIFLLILISGVDCNKIYAVLGSFFVTSNDDGRHWNSTSFTYSNTCFSSYDGFAGAKIFISSTKIYVARGGANYASCYLATSDDDGRTWMNNTKIPKYNWAQSLFVTENRIYVGTSEGLLISQDGGATWIIKTTADGLGRDSISSVYGVGTKIYAGTEGGGLAISADGGKTWIIKSTFHGLGDAQVNSVFAVGDKVYVGTEQGLSISLDGGQVWVNKNQSNGLGPQKHLEGDGCNIQTVFIANNKIYVGLGYNPPDAGYLYISGDGGNTWTPKTSHDGLGKGAGVSLFVLDDEIYMGCTGLDMISLSRDNGQSWITVTNTRIHEDYHLKSPIRSMYVIS